LKKTDANIQYYDENAHAFFENTSNADLLDIQNRFLSHIKTGRKILDLGCGSGRDARYFLDCGYEVEATDGSPEMCRLASALLNQPVKQMLFQDLQYIETYDGIWACASILHMKKAELPDMFRRIDVALKKEGVFYTSFKHGTFEGMRNGRYFTDLDKPALELILKDAALTMKPVDLWISDDARVERRSEQWFNIIFVK